MNQYFISNQGNDNHDGRTVNTAWKTIKRINETVLTAGDEILFNRGDLFSGELLIQQSGTAESPIIIRAYGEGELPILTGTVTENNWKSEPNNQFVSNINSPVYQLFFNDKWMDLARIPAKGFYTIEEGDKNSLTDTQHLNVSYDLTNAILRIRAVNWQYETNKVAAHKNGTITFAESMIYQANPRYGYFLDNKLEKPRIELKGLFKS